jgi:hypothetical protein
LREPTAPPLDTDLRVRKSAEPRSVLRALPIRRGADGVSRS